MEHTLISESSTSSSSRVEQPEVESSASHSDVASESGLPCTVYSPESLLRHPLRLLQEIGADLWRSRELISILFMRDLKAQYRQSYLGYLWIFAGPVLSSFVWFFLQSQNVIGIADTPIPYAAFVLIGTSLWGTFSAAFNAPKTAFAAGKAVFMKLKVPPEAFIATGLSKVVFDFVIRSLILVPVFMVFNIVPPATALLFPVAVLCLMIFACAIGMLLLPLASLYNDIGTAMGLVLTFLMYLTPVIYPPPKSGLAATIVAYNPVTPFIMTARDWLTLGSSAHAPAMLMLTAASLVLLAFSCVILRVCMPHLVVRMGM